MASESKYLVNYALATEKGQLNTESTKYANYKLCTLCKHNSQESTEVPCSDAFYVISAKIF